MRLPESWRNRAIVISGVGPDESWFDEIPTFPREKRREEWMHARIAAKQLAIDKGLCTDPRAIRVERPRIFINGEPSEFVSISHSHPYAGAALDREPVGIDVQVIRELREEAAHLFLSDDETSAMRSTNIAHRLIHFWCAKEAAWKQRYGEVTTLKQIPLILVEEREDGLLFDTVETISRDDVVVALTRPIS